MFSYILKQEIRRTQFLKKTAFSVLFFFITHIAFSQNVIISEYYNDNYPSDEWAELLVIDDNTDLRGYTFRGNNSSQTNWGTAITFTSNTLWNNLRSGTIIVIWFRNINSSNIAIPLDTNKSDGFIQVHCMLSTHFSYIGTQNSVFGTAPYTSSTGNSFVVANVGDIYQIRDNSNNHVHALGHKSGSTGTTYTGISGTQKLNHNSAISVGDNVYVCPASSLSEYIGGFSGTTWTAKGSSNISQGLPNTCTTSPSQPNRAYWRSLRQPNYNSPTLNTISANSDFTQTNLSWSACTDTNPNDSISGYIILRNTSNSFISPSDSIVYTVGNTIGTASVIANINYSSTLVYYDNFAFTCGTTYYYKIYAFRFGNDDINGNSFNAARGRAYNETGTNVQSISKSYPQAQTIIPN